MRTWWRRTSLEMLDSVVVPAALALATFLAATPWLRAFAVPATVGLVLIAAAGSVTIPSLAIRVWRRSPVVSYAASAAALVVLLFAVAGLHPDGLWQGLAHGPNRVLTETLPISGDRALMAAPLVLIWLCGTATTELVMRARGSSGTMALGLVLPIGCFVLAYAVSAARPGHDEIAAPILFVTLLLIAMFRHVVAQGGTRQAIIGSAVEGNTRPSKWSPGAAGGALAVVVAIGLGVVIPMLPAMSQTPASLNRAPPLTTATVVDPVDALAALRDENPHDPPRTVLQVDTSGPSTGYLAMAVLDDYDGAGWSFAATFHPTGGRIPLPPGAHVAVTDVTTVRQQYTLAAPLPVSFLPALDRPVGVGGLEVAADSSTGMFLPAHANTGALAYSVVSLAPAVTLASVPAADGIGEPAGQNLAFAGVISAADVTLPPNTTTAIAAAMRFLTTLTGQRPAPTVAFLQSVMTSLHADERRIDPALASPSSPNGTVSSPNGTGKKGTGSASTTTLPPPVGAVTTGGTSLAEVINAVTIDRAATPEQFATLYAMVARYLGVPARVVTGFRIATGSASGLVGLGAHQVTDRQAWTWVEIPVAGLGWVVADPTPDARTAASTPPPEAVSATATTLPSPPANAVPVGDIKGAHALAKPAPIQISRSFQLVWWVVVLFVVVGPLLVLGLVGPGLAGARRLRRRWSRRREEPSQLAVGAWLELIDGLHQAGMLTGVGDTSEEVAIGAGRHFGPEVTEPVRQVGVLADRAVCSIKDPPDRQAAARAWEASMSVRRAVLRSLDRRQRARALLSVGAAPRRPSVASGSRAPKRLRTVLGTPSQPRPG